MDAMDILGSLIGGKSKSGGIGGKILKDILTRGQGGGATQQPAPRAPQQQQRAPQQQQRQQIPQQAERPYGAPGGAKSLDDLLREAHIHTERPDRQTGRRDVDPQRFPRQQRTIDPRQLDHPVHPQTDDDQAVLLIRAMINAAKCDGQVDREEQDRILGRLGHVTPEEIEFVKRELAAPLDLREFVWSVPLGLEEQVYIASLMAIDLDTSAEARYLLQLAHGLRLHPQACDQIHDRLNAPRINR